SSGSVAARGPRLPDDPRRGRALRAMSSEARASDAAPSRVELWLRFPLVACAVLALAVYAGVALARIRYPFDLAWTEGAQVDRVQRVLDGGPIYVAPSVDYVPLIYAPLYDWVSALVALATGIGYLPLRLVSFASSFAAFALIFAFVRRATGKASL